VTRNYFDEPHASRYDEFESEMFEPAVVDPIVDLLTELADGGPALELGVGTGRIALPLSARGTTVHGIDLSEAMLARLRAKRGADRVGVTRGDFATARAPGRYRLAYLVFNTINNLTTQEEQIACFRNVSQHLDPGGRFVLEVGVPRLRRLPPGQNVHPFTVTDDHVGFDEYDLLTQGLISHHFTRAGEHWERMSIPFRYVWPSELDLMARLAGMELRARWAGWRREPFTSESDAHVSVWQKLPD
jgi:SAM-dependent methyltransferase